MNLKKLSIVFLVITILLLFSINVQASSDTVHFVHGDETVDLPTYVENLGDNFNKYHYFIFDLSGTYYLYVCTDSLAYKATYEYRSSRNQHKFMVRDENENNLESSWYYYNGTSWIFQNGGTGAVFNGDLTMLVSTIDIYNYGTDELFFRLPPLSSLAKVVEETETERTLQQIVAIIPMILVVVVCFLGLRKALRMLSGLLHQA